MARPEPLHHLHRALLSSARTEQCPHHDQQDGAHFDAPQNHQREDERGGHPCDALHHATIQFHRMSSHPSFALEIARLHFRYPDRGAGKQGFELQLPSLTLRRGEELLLVGRSGCGKSTLLQLIAGLIDPTSGTVQIGAQDMHALKGAARDRFRGRSIGMVFQTFNLLQGFSALENVLAALLMSDLVSAESCARAETLLRSLGIERLDARVEELSVGQQQRVAVARALACQPTLVLADEPTASLDPENALNAVRVLRDACREQGAALLVVSHDPSLAQHFERRQILEALTVGASVGEGARA